MARKRKKNNSEQDMPDLIIDTRQSSKKHRDEIHGVIKDTNDAAHRILDIATETRDIADSANDKVHEQGEQIDGIANTVADTNVVVKTSKKEVKGINSIWHAIKNFFTPKCLQPEKIVIDDTGTQEIQTQRDKEQVQRKKGKHGKNSGEAHPAITVLFDTQTQKVNKDTFDTLTTVEDVMGDMNALARKTNKELRRQNGVLEQVDELVDETNEDLAKTNAVAKKYLNH